MNGQYLHVLDNIERIDYLLQVTIPDWLEVDGSTPAQRRVIEDKLRAAKAHLETAINAVAHRPRAVGF